jgi:hypothetical protein
MKDDTSDTSDIYAAFAELGTLDVPRALDPGTVRAGGHRALIRRRLFTGAGAVGGAAALVAGAVTLAGVLMTDSGNGAPAVAGASTAHPPSADAKVTPTKARPTMSHQKPGRPPANPVADIPVAAADLPRLFTKLYPGKVTPAEAETGQIIDDGRQAQVAHFRWNGLATSVGFTAYAGTPVQACREDQQDTNQSGNPSVTCLKRPDGTVLTSRRNIAPAVDGGGVSHSAVLYTKDGYLIFAISYNSATMKGSTAAAEPPFSTAQLTRAVTSGVWYR